MSMPAIGNCFIHVQFQDDPDIAFIFTATSITYGNARENYI